MDRNFSGKLCAKPKSTLVYGRILADTIAVLTSLVLQYGVPVEALARKFEGTRFEPSGQTTNPKMRDATSITDYVFRWLGLVFSETYAEEYATRMLRD